MKKRRYIFFICVSTVLWFASVGCGRVPEKAKTPAAEAPEPINRNTAPADSAADDTSDVKLPEDEAENPAADDAESVKTEEIAKTVEKGKRTGEMKSEQQAGPAAYSFREDPLVIELDAGHGAGGGAENERHGVLEREVNLQIALRLKEELETYENVTVYLTREDASDIELEDRVKKAVDDGADVLISLHNNAAGSICDYYNGCTVLVARGAKDPELAEITQELGCYILKGLEEAGSENQGLMFRVTQDELYYDDGSLCDYYSIVRNSVKAGIPGIIVEHAFLDNEEDYQMFFADREKIDRLAIADAKGIAGYYHLKKKGGDEIPMVLEGHTEKITLIVSDDYRDNTYMEKTYFLK